MKMNIEMWINRKSCLSPTVYNSLQSFAEFNVDMHNIYIRAHKDPTKQWTKLPVVATDDTIFTGLEAWPPEWLAPNIAKLERSATKKKKDNAKLRIAQLVEKRQKETVATKVWAGREVAQKAAKQENAAIATTTQEVATKTVEGQTMPSQGQAAEETETQEEGTDPQTASTQLKRQHPVE